MFGTNGVGTLRKWPDVVNILHSGIIQSLAVTCISITSRSPLTGCIVYVGHFACSLIVFIMQALGIKVGPRILDDVSVKVRSIDEAGGVAGEECAEVVAADNGVALAFVDAAPAVLVLGIRALAIQS